MTNEQQQPPERLSIGGQPGEPKKPYASAREFTDAVNRSQMHRTVLERIVASDATISLDEIRRLYK